MTVRPDKPPSPNPAELAELLGPGISLWADLQEGVRAAHAPVTERWVYGGRKYGWTCRLERGKRGIVYMTPDAGYFRVGLALPDAAREAVLASDMPAEIRESLASATKAMEGWPLRMAVRTADDAAVVLRLVGIKLSAG